MAGLSVAADLLGRQGVTCCDQVSAWRRVSKTRSEPGQIAIWPGRSLVRYNF